MVDTEILNQNGIDYNAGVERFLGDAELYERVLRVYAADNIVARARAAFDKRDCAALLAAVHEAKGSSGNMNLNNVYADSCALVDLLRAGGFSDAELSERFERFEQSYSGSQQTILSALK